MKGVQIGLVVVFALVCVHPAVAGEDPTQEYNRLLRTGRLPASMTEAEKDMPQSRPTMADVRSRSGPTGAVHCPAEYEPCAGLIMSWSSGFSSELTDLVVAMTTHADDTTAWIAASSSSQPSIYNTLNNAGADMDQVVFLNYTTTTVWMRDYGPRYIFEDGARAIIDHDYNRPRPADNAFNDWLSGQWSETQYDIPLEHGGGNFHLFTNGDAFMSELILDENPGLSEQDVVDLYAEYQNLDLTIYPGFDSSYDSTRHIDMWMMPVDNDKIIIGQYSSGGSWNPHPYTVTQGAVADLQSRGYTVYRTPGWTSGGTHYTYTNSVVVNDLIMIPEFNSPTNDATAKTVFETARPDATVVQIDCSDIIHYAGAIHCIVMHVPRYAPTPTVTVQTPNGGEDWFTGEPHDIEWIAYDDYGVTGVDIHYSIDGGATFPHEIVTGYPNTGTYAWTPGETPSDQCVIRVTAHDGDLNTGEDVSDAVFTLRRPPQMLHHFNLDSEPGWSVQGLWDHGSPLGLGSHNDDPNSGYTGANVYGYNLYGDYTSGMTTPDYLTTTAIDCTGATDVELRFWRWLGVEGSDFDQASIDVSADGSNWTTVWQHSGGAIADVAWVQQQYDISAIADGEPTVYIRWGMGPTDSSTTYPGWNIDDIEIWGAPAGVLPGDIDADGDLDGDDCYWLAQVLLETNTYPAEYVDRCDLNGDDAQDGHDIAAFVDLFD